MGETRFSNVAIFGCSGASGREVLRSLLTRAGEFTIFCVSRSGPADLEAKLQCVVQLADRDTGGLSTNTTERRLRFVQWDSGAAGAERALEATFEGIQLDAVFSAVGCSRANADVQGAQAELGVEEGFTKHLQAVDVGVNQKLAAFAKAQKVKHFARISSVGADAAATSGVGKMPACYFRAQGQADDFVLQTLRRSPTTVHIFRPGPLLRSADWTELSRESEQSWVFRWFGLEVRKLGDLVVREWQRAARTSAVTFAAVGSTPDGDGPPDGEQKIIKIGVRFLGMHYVSGIGSDSWSDSWI